MKVKFESPNNIEILGNREDMLVLHKALCEIMALPQSEIKKDLSFSDMNISIVRKPVEE